MSFTPCATTALADHLSHNGHLAACILQPARTNKLVESLYGTPTTDNTKLICVAHTTHGMPRSFEYQEEAFVERKGVSMR